MNHKHALIRIEHINNSPAYSYALYLGDKELCRIADSNARLSKSFRRLARDGIEKIIKSELSNVHFGPNIDIVEVLPTTLYCDDQKIEFGGLELKLNHTIHSIDHYHPNAVAVCIHKCQPSISDHDYQIYFNDEAVSGFCVHLHTTHNSIQETINAAVLQHKLNNPNNERYNVYRVDIPLNSRGMYDSRGMYIAVGGHQLKVVNTII